MPSGSVAPFGRADVVITASWTAAAGSGWKLPAIAAEAQHPAQGPQ